MGDGGGDAEGELGVAAAYVEDLVRGLGGEVGEDFGGEEGDEGGGCFVGLWLISCKGGGSGCVVLEV